MISGYYDAVGVKLLRHEAATERPRGRPNATLRIRASHTPLTWGQPRCRYAHGWR